MEYRFDRTAHGPVIVGEDEIVFFHQFAQLQDYINEDPEFFTKAYDFCQSVIAEYGELLAKGVKESVVGVDQATSIIAYWVSVDNLRRFEHSLNNSH
jgi:hypothetical protein